MSTILEAQKYTNNQDICN